MKTQRPWVRRVVHSPMTALGATTFFLVLGSRLRPR